MSRLRSTAVKVALVAASVMATLLAMEVYFRYVRDEPDGWGFSRQHRVWQERYWGPENALGMRDVDYTAAQLQGKRLIVVLGDSFTEGFGIESREDRYVDILRREVSAADATGDWRVVMLAKGGFDTRDELRMLRAFRLPPEIVVLQYYINDIAPDEHAEDFRPPGGLLEVLTHHSALVDFVYWRMHKLSLVRRFPDMSRTWYTDPERWNTHRGELAAFVSHCRQRGARVVALVIPRLIHVEDTATYTAQVAAELRSLGVETLDVAPDLVGRPARELTAGPDDTHANERLHAWFAELILDRIRPWLATPPPARP